MFEKITEKFKPEDILVATRDITFLSCSIFSESYRIGFKKEFKKTFFKNIFWFQLENKQIKLYRSIKENSAMAKIIGDRFLEDIKFAKKITSDLITMSEEINLFLDKNKKKEKLIKNWEYFFELYKKFFVYHQVSYWPIEYLNRIKNKSRQKNKIEKIVKIFDEAYKYNEKVIPKVEKYFLKLGIANYYFDELINEKINNRKNLRKSILLLDKKTNILNEKEAIKINYILEKKYNNYIKKEKVIKGLSVQKGKVKGKVKLVKNFFDFKKCQSSDILVTQMTRPQYNFFIKKVKAIITDEGGLLCHASILAR